MRQHLFRADLQEVRLLDIPVLQDRTRFHTAGLDRMGLDQLFKLGLPMGEP